MSSTCISSLTYLTVLPVHGLIALRDHVTLVTKGIDIDRHERLLRGGMSVSCNTRIYLPRTFLGIDKGRGHGPCTMATDLYKPQAADNCFFILTLMARLPSHTCVRGPRELTIARRHIVPSQRLWLVCGLCCMHRLNIFLSWFAPRSGRALFFGS